MQKVITPLFATILSLTFVSSTSAQSDNVLRNPQVSTASFAITPPLRELVKNQPTELQFGYHHAPPAHYPKQNLALKGKNLSPNFEDAAAQTESLAGTVPVDLLDWLGIGVGFFGYSVPDAPIRTSRTTRNSAFGRTVITPPTTISRIYSPTPV